jgi:hypothetical protein
MMTLSETEFYAADVNRWHASVVPELRGCGDTIQTHQMRCVGLVSRLITAPKRTLIEATRWHDQPEVILGDMPFTAKRDFPGFAAAWDTMERHVIAQYDVPQPADQWEADVVKLVDRMDAYMIARKHARWILDEPDWRDALTDIYEKGRALNFNCVIGIMTA